MIRFRSIRRTALALPLALLTACGPAGDDEPVNPLHQPSLLNETAPESFRVRMETSEGDLVIEVHRDWAPLGADRFYNLVRAGYYDDTRVYRVVEGFMAQFGFNGDGVINYVWRDEFIQDDPVVQSNTRGRVTFAKAGPNTRNAHLFINYADNSRLDEDGFAPFGEVVSGMEVADAFHAGYGEGPPRGDGPYQTMIEARGNEYLDRDYPDLTRIIRMVAEEP